MELAPRPPYVVQLDDGDDPVDIVETMLLGPFVAGELPVARDLELPRVRPGATLLPPGVAPIREARAYGRHAVLGAGEGWLLRSVRFNDGRARVAAVATDAALADAVLRDATLDAVEPAPPADEAAIIRFWHHARCGATSTSRSLAIEPWRAIRCNYAGAAAGALDRVMRIAPVNLRGRLLLMHGPTGTGKTTALRALAHAWRGWCDLEYVLDLDELFAYPSYLMRVLLGDGDDGIADDTSARWRLLVLEDCDELLRSNAKEHAGQALARLLNLTDGLVGQGLDVLVCLTTNEELARLHPAIVRPGRCVAQVHVGPLSRPEAKQWLGTDHGIGPGGATLAELCALRGDVEQVAHEEARSTNGLYL